MKKIVLKLIEIYQKTISPDHGVIKKAFPHGFCRFYPTCSEYTHGSIKRFGLIKGMGLGFWRVLRCNPFSRGGKDLVPIKFKKDYFVFGFIFLTIYLLIMVSLITFIIRNTIL